MTWENVIDEDDNITGDIYVVFKFEHEEHRCACTMRITKVLLDSIIAHEIVVDFITKYFVKGVSKITKDDSITAKHLYGSVVTVIRHAQRGEPFIMDYRKNKMEEEK